MKNTWKNTVFLRLFLMFLLLMLPLCGIGIGIYNWGVWAIRNEINKSMVAQVTFYLNGLDTEIQRMKVLMYECTSNDDLNRLTFASQSFDNFEKSQALLRLQQQLRSIKGSSRYIDDAYVSIIKLETTVSAVNGIVKGVDKDLKKFLLSPYMSSYSQMIYLNGRFYLNVVWPLANNNTQKISFVITIRLTEEAFTDDLNQFNTYAGSISLLTSKNARFVLVNGNNSFSKSKVRDQLLEKMSQSVTGTYNEYFVGKRYLAVYSTSEYLNISLARYIPEKAVLSYVKKYQIWLWVYAAASLVIIVLFSISIYGFIHKPLNLLVKAFKNVESGDLQVSIEHHHNDEFRSLYHSFNTMVGKLNTLFDQMYKQKILMQNAQLKQLQAQINPHFLYNTFFILYSIARAEDYENLMSFLQQLGSYFKFITRNSEDEVTLSREIEHARTYTNIQALRFSRRITIKFDQLPDRFKNFMVPRLIVQPIIENSFKYGLENKESDGLLLIRFRESTSFLHIIIEDNGSGMNHADIVRLKNNLEEKQYEGEMTGIINIHRRLQLKFGGRSGLDISNSETGGLKVTIKLELKGDTDGNV